MLEVQAEQIAEPKTRRWSREEYYQMYELGWFQDQRVELIGGEVLEMAPQLNSHAMAMGLVDRALRAMFDDSFWIRCQLPLRHPDESEPEPDFAVVPGGPRDYADHPEDALLVVEIAATTLDYDKGRKAGLYAAAGIADYWIVNLVDHRLEVRRGPVADAREPFGHRYAEATFHQRGDSVTPLARPEARVAVDDLLP